MILTSYALLERNPNPAPDEVREYLVGNLCRCTGYKKIVDAVLLAAEWKREGAMVIKLGRPIEVVGKNVLKVDGILWPPGSLSSPWTWTSPAPSSESFSTRLMPTQKSSPSILLRRRRVPGVVCILHHGNVPRVPYTTAGQGWPEPSPYDTVLFDKKVRYVGDRVAAVAAERREAALEALAKSKWSTKSFPRSSASTRLWLRSAHHPRRARCPGNL
jgi:putative selenate reductase molybdopterin-binding subunit